MKKDLETIEVEKKHIEESFKQQGAKYDKALQQNKDEYASNLTKKSNEFKEKENELKAEIAKVQEEKQEIEEELKKNNVDRDTYFKEVQKQKNNF